MNEEPKKPQLSFSGMKFSNIKTAISYVLFSIYLIFYLAFTLTIGNLQISPTINRVTYFDTPVHWSITGFLEQDILIASIIFSSAIILLFQKHVSIPLSLMTLIPSIVGTIYIENYREISNFFFISTLPIIIFLIVWLKFSWVRKKNTGPFTHTKIHNFEVKEFLVWFFFVLLTLEAIVLIIWLIKPVTDLPEGHWSQNFTFLENNLFYAFGLLSPIIIVLSLFSFLIRSNIRNLYKWIKKKFPSVSLTEQPDSVEKANYHKQTAKKSERGGYTGLREGFFIKFKSEKNNFLLLILVAVIPSILISLYPYALISNPDIILGTDIPDYTKKITILADSKDFPSYVHQAFAGLLHGDRPFSYITIHLISIISGHSLEFVLKYLPALLAPLMVVSVYFLVRFAYDDNHKLAILSAILMATSHQVIIGFYAAFYANWMALIIVFISSIFLLKSIKKPYLDSKSVFLFAILTISVLFLHSYTWSYYIVVISLFLVWTAITKLRSNQNLKVVAILGVITVGIIALDVTKSYFVGESTGFEKDLVLAEDFVSLKQFAERWRNLNSTFTWYLGGFLTNSALILLLFLWTLKSNYMKNSDRFFLSFIFVAILPILFGDFLVQSRLFYTIPFQIPASLMLYSIYVNPKINFRKPLLFTIIFMQFNYAFRAMANMNFISPG